jgi:hypothetical protein
MSLQVHQHSSRFTPSVVHGANSNPMALLVAAVRESIEDINQDVKFYAEKMQELNDVAEAMNDYLQELADASSRLASAEKPRLDPGILKPDLARLSNALRHRRMMEKSHSIGIDHLTRRIHAALWRWPRKH